MLPAEERLPALLPYVEQRQYFVVHAARQTRKTTAIRAFAERLRGLGYAAVWGTLEDRQGVTETAEAMTCNTVWTRACYAKNLGYKLTIPSIAKCWCGC